MVMPTMPHLRVIAAVCQTAVTQTVAAAIAVMTIPASTTAQVTMTAQVMILVAVTAILVAAIATMIAARAAAAKQIDIDETYLYNFLWKENKPFITFTVFYQSRVATYHYIM